MIHKVTEPKTIEHLLADWQEAVIWSALQGVMGDIYAPQSLDSAMVILGDFCYLAGKPSEELVAFKPADCEKDFLIMVPENEAWEKLIEEHYKEKAKKITRYAIHKDRGYFDKEKLQQALSGLPEGCQLRMIDRELYDKCLANEWSRDFVSNYKDYEMFERLGLGVVMVRMSETGRGENAKTAVEDSRGEGTLIGSSQSETPAVGSRPGEAPICGEIIAGASSYATYNEGIEIEIVTREDSRRQGLAYICASKLILECLKRKLYPSWDARTKISVALAEKLGYEYSHEYVAYDIVGY